MGSEYELALQDSENVGGLPSGNDNRRIGQMTDKKRCSSREKKPVNIEDIGYVDKEQGKKGGKGSYITSEGYRKCERLLAQLKKHQYVSRFLNQSETLPGKEIVDLNNVEKKLKSGQYPSSYLFALDVRKIWSNSWESNDHASPIYAQTTEISNYFEKLMKEVGDMQIIAEESSEIQQLKKQMNKVTGALRKITGNAGPSQSKGYSGGTPRGGDRGMTIQEKSILKQSIMKLPQDKLTGVIEIIRGAVDINQAQGSLEFDIDDLPPKKCKELEIYVKKNIIPQKSNKKKNEKVLFAEIM
jgi:hypothetical protein